MPPGVNIDLGNCCHSPSLSRFTREVDMVCSQLATIARYEASPIRRSGSFFNFDIRGSHSFLSGVGGFRHIVTTGSRSHLRKFIAAMIDAIWAFADGSTVFWLAPSSSPGAGRQRGIFESR
jgi:hypothetical protein